MSKNKWYPIAFDLLSQTNLYLCSSNFLLPVEQTCCQGQCHEKNIILTHFFNSPQFMWRTFDLHIHNCLEKNGIGKKKVLFAASVTFCYLFRESLNSSVGLIRKVGSHSSTVPTKIKKSWTFSLFLSFTEIHFFE